MKIINLLLFSIISFTFNVTASSIIKETRNIGNTSQITINSKVLNETRNLLIHLPDTYNNSDTSYPVIYLLDGERHFNHAIIATELLQQQERVPELIIVAITNVGEWGNDGGKRQQDLGYSGKDKFLKYIKNEVMPYVNNNYRTSGLNTLFGHSLAGYFTTDSLASHSDLFQNYIAASPVLQGDEEAIHKKLLNNKKLDTVKEKSFYFSLASADEARNKAVTYALNNFVKLLTRNPVNNLDWQYEFFDNQTHSTIYYPTFFNGMTYVFKNYQAPHFPYYDEYQSFGGMQAIEAHYAKRAQIYGTDKNIPEKVLTDLAHMLFNESKMQDALQLYSKLTLDFPQSASSFSGLGQVYSEMKLYEKSIKAHQKAVTLAKSFSPQWQQRRFKRQLENAMKHFKSLEQASIH